MNLLLHHFSNFVFGQKDKGIDRYRFYKRIYKPFVTFYVMRVSYDIRGGMRHLLRRLFSVSFHDQLLFEI